MNFESSDFERSPIFVSRALTDVSNDAFRDKEILQRGSLVDDVKVVLADNSCISDSQFTG